MKHYLWHGNIEAALERLEPLLCDLDLIRRRSNSVAKLCRSATECDTYIRNKMDAQRSTSPAAHVDSCAQRQSGCRLSCLAPEVSPCTDEPTWFLMVSFATRPTLSQLFAARFRTNRVRRNETIRCAQVDHGVVCPTSGAPWACTLRQSAAS